MAAAVSIIAIVDDDEFVRRALKRLLVSLSYRSTEFASGVAFLDGLETMMPACCLLDLYMPDFSGLQVLEAMRERDLHIPTIVITADSGSDVRDRCLLGGAADFLQKPLEHKLVAAAISSAT